jgi:LuxR family maltose regulon positive regulatory protein
MSRLPVVRNGALYITPATAPVPVDTEAWCAWLDEARSFTFISTAGTFTARHEKRSGRRFWYAYRQQNGVLRKAYLGRSADLTLPRLEAAARDLALPNGKSAQEDLMREWASPLIATKIAIPLPGPSLIARPDVVAHCVESTARPCTIITAPPGFGKTTLLIMTCAQLKAQGWGIAWVSLEETEQDPARFWDYVLAALDGVRPGISTTARRMLATPRPQPSDHLLTALINDLAAVPDPIALVLDDYHRAATEASDQGLAFLIEHAPASLHLIVATRAEPAFLPARLRAQGRIATLNVADLRFSPAETGQFMRETMHLTLPDAQLAQLAERTEGWAAGLQLAALSLRDHVGTPNLLASTATTPRYIAEYLIDEVLAQQPAEVQAFLLQTSVLERLSGPLCDAVTGGNDGAAMLARLMHAQLFLTPLDAAQTWYRYHHLFAEVLRERLARTAPATLHQCHMRAAAWLRQQGDTSEAIHHCIAAQAHEEAARLIEGESDRLLLRGEMAGLVTLGRALPRATLLAHPHLCVLFALGLIFQSAGSEAGAWLDALEQEQAATGERADAIAGEIAVVRSVFRLLNTDFTGGAILARQALHLLPPDAHLLRALALWLISIIGMLGDDDLAVVHRRISTIAEESMQSGNMFVAYIALVTKAAAELYQGRLRQMAQTCREALRLLPPVNSVELPIAAVAYCLLSEIQREWNDLTGAEEDIRHAMTIGLYPSNSEFLNDGLLTLAMLQAERGQGEEALATFEEIGHMIRTQQLASMDMYQLEVLRTRTLLMMGHIPEAARWADECRQRRREGDPLLDLSFLREVQDLALARVALAQNQAEEIIAPLESLCIPAQHAGRLRNLLEARMLLARARWHLGATAAALRDLDAALTIAAPENFTRVFLDEGEPMADLLAAYAANRPASRERAHALKLLATFGRPLVPTTLTQSTMLSPRELDVLRLLAAGHSNEAIAGDLVVARSTVKWHVAQISRKLGATGRVQVIARARELHLIA